MVSNERVTSQVLNALGGGLLGALLWVLSLHLGRVAVETSIGPTTVSGALCGLLISVGTPFSCSLSSCMGPSSVPTCISASKFSSATTATAAESMAERSLNYGGIK